MSWNRSHLVPQGNEEYIPQSWVHLYGVDRKFACVGHRMTWDLKVQRPLHEAEGDGGWLTCAGESAAAGGCTGAGGSGSEQI